MQLNTGSSIPALFSISRTPSIVLLVHDLQKIVSALRSLLSGGR